MSNKIILGSRGSKLSIAYANKVLSLLSNIKPALDKEVILKTIKTFRAQKISCHHFWQKGRKL